ncbi:MAG: acetyl-CoA carboxylase biotin carboxylase subunit [Rickettsiales bacterium]|jgi:propionyl-CoA carboxylase alpha chain|nr:acetyl-CoA carboxylase biotin carboxylase subunit [Rickettsiales bacterium]
MNTIREKILIANRGEIACRIIKTAKKMGIATVAVYSEADSNSLHVQMADEAVFLGDNAALNSYLNMKKIVNIAKRTNSTFVHPGCGFLAENAKFAILLEKEKINFIAPPVGAIQKMGDKIESKIIAKKAGVNIVPGYENVVKTSTEAVQVAKKIGLPVMIKASAGGGGKGMRMVSDLKDVKEAFEIATNEAVNSFGDGRILIERFIERPRHIEIQVIGDKFGNIVCLGERECSIQRNNQKVIEEAPSPFIDEKTRQKMYSQVVSLCKEVGYYSAGTIEFMVDKDKDFYFLEMNTRLQVEHGITELITDTDIVELMIKVARGEKLDFTQKDVKLKGWAIESRICAEDPSRGFLPSSGRINKYVEPTNIENVRVDTGVCEGYEVTSYYDSMIAKLLTYAPTRIEAVEKMQTALGNFYINGIAHNMAFLEKIMYNERFRSGDINTSFIKEEFFSGNVSVENEGKNRSCLVGVALYIYYKYQKRILSITGVLREQNRKISGRLVTDVNGKKYLCDVYEKDNEFDVAYGTGYLSLTTEWKQGEKIFRGIVNNKEISVKIFDNDYSGNYIFQYMGDVIPVSVRTPRVSELEQFMPPKNIKEKPRSLKSPIAGKITKLKVKEGDSVLAGTELCCIEAMKMENIIRTDYDLKIKKIYKNVGDLVNNLELVMDFEYDDGN